MDMILGQYSNGDISVTNLTATCMVIDILWHRMARYIPSKVVQAGSKYAGGAKTKTKKEVVKVTRPPPRLSPGSWAWRKQMSATDTRLQFTGDKNWQKTKHLHLPDIIVLNNFLLWTRVRLNWLTETSDLLISLEQNLLETEIVVCLVKAGFENHTSSEETGL